MADKTRIKTRLIWIVAGVVIGSVDIILIYKGVGGRTVCNYRKSLIRMVTLAKLY